MSQAPENRPAGATTNDTNAAGQPKDGKQVDADLTSSAVNWEKPTLLQGPDPGAAMDLVPSPGPGADAERLVPALGPAPRLGGRLARRGRLQDPGRARPRRHGRRLQGPPARPEPDRGPEDGPGGRPRRQPAIGPLPDRGRVGRARPAPQ